MQLEVFLPWFLAKVVGTTPTADPKGRKERCCLRRRSDTSTLINVKDLGRTVPTIAQGFHPPQTI